MVNCSSTNIHSMVQSLQAKQDFVISFKKNSQSYKTLGRKITGNSLTLMDLGTSQIYILKTKDSIVTIPLTHIRDLMHLNYN